MGTNTSIYNGQSCKLFYLVLSMMITIFPAHAKSYLVLLSKDAPTPESIVSASQNKVLQDEWPLSSFITLQPESVDYLSKNRPKGSVQLSIAEFPDGITAKLSRYLKIELPSDLDENFVVNSLMRDPQIEFASAEQVFVFPLQADKDTSFKNNLNSRAENKVFDANFLVDLNIISAWELSEGMGYIGAMDFGFETLHDDIRSFDDSGYYLGGNILDSSGISGLSYIEDTGTDAEDFNVDEKQLYFTNGNPELVNCDLADGFSTPDYYKPYIAGHGTHVTGIMAGKNHSVGGVCKNCGMGMMKFSTQYIPPTNPPAPCIFYNGTYIMRVHVPETAIFTAYENLTNMGVGTVNYSGGYIEKGSLSVDCDRKPLGSVCLQQTLLLSRNIMLVAAAGNDKKSKPQYPARDVSVVAVGGLDDEVGDFWDDSICPYPGHNDECGSNSSNLGLGHKIDVVTQAKNVYSTFYNGAVHNVENNCKDDNDGINDGYGFCTGTSMSTPQVSGIVQLMRSAHPLLPNGTYDPALKTGLINVLNATASQTTSGLNNDNELGYGVPDARLAIEMILGQSDEVQMKTRLTPMFEMYSSGHNNHVYTPFSQVALSFMSIPVNGPSSNSYLSNSNADSVSEFPYFWYDQNSESFDSPKASFYVFTTNNNPFTGIKDMVPLRRMEKSTVDINDVIISRNDTYVINTGEINDYRDNFGVNFGYNFAGIEGYILPPCTPQPNCTIPEGSTRLYRDQSNSMNHKLVPASSAPNGSSVLLGYVYLNQDSDNDGLIDGQEIVLGTNYLDPVNDVDTDGDGLTDAEEYPPAGVPVSDPLVNPNPLDWLPAVVGLVLG